MRTSCSSTEQTVNRTLSTTIGTCKKKILSAQSYDLQSSFRRIIIDFDAAVITEAQQCS
jgi:hypothetical protein